MIISLLNHILVYFRIPTSTIFPFKDNYLYTSLQRPLQLRTPTRLDLELEEQVDLYHHLPIFGIYYSLYEFFQGTYLCRCYYELI